MDSTAFQQVSFHDNTGNMAFNLGDGNSRTVATDLADCTCKFNLVCEVMQILIFEFFSYILRNGSLEQFLFRTLSDTLLGRTFLEL